MDIMEIWKPIMLAIATAIAGLIGTYGAKALKKLIEFLKSKSNSVIFNAARELAKGIYLYLEEKYYVPGTGDLKRKEMENMLLEKYPSLTKTELDAINKEIWNSFNQEYNKRING